MVQYIQLKTKYVRDYEFEIARLGDIFYFKVYQNKLVMYARCFPTLKLANSCWRRAYNAVNYGRDIEEAINE